MKDVIIQDYPDTVGFDFEPSQMNPSDMIHEIIDLARQCYERKLAYVNIENTANGQVYICMTTDIDVEEYKILNDYHIMPRNWSEMERLECRYDDAMYLMGIVLKLQKIVGGEGVRESLQQVYNRIDASENPLSDALKALAKAGGEV